MIRSGVVVEKQGRTLGVVFERPAACHSCSGCLNKNCSRVQLTGDAEIGDTVDVDMPDGNLVKASAVMYIVPVCTFLVGLLVGYLIYRGGAVSMTEDLFYAVCGVVACALGFGVVWIADKALGRRKRWQPHIIAVHKGGQPE